MFFLCLGSVSGHHSPAMGLAPVSMVLGPSSQQSVPTSVVLCCLGLADGSLKDSTEMGWQESLGQPCGHRHGGVIGFPWAWSRGHVRDRWIGQRLLDQHNRQAMARVMNGFKWQELVTAR